MILVPAGRRFAPPVFDMGLSVIVVVVLALLVVVDGLGVAGAKVEATASSSVIAFVVIFVVVAVPIAWNATNALYELAGIFLCLVVILVLVEL